MKAADGPAARRAVPALMTWPIPAGLDAARAACVPVAFGTAYEGMAAIQLASTSEARSCLSTPASTR